MTTNSKELSAQREYFYIIDSDPVPLARMRIGNRRVWDPQRELKLVTQIALRNQHKGALLKGPLHVHVVFYFHIPKTRKDLHPGFTHCIKPDLDNLLKFLLDIGNNVIWGDDCQISSVTCQKLYADHARTVFTITRLERDSNGTKKP